jgi:hypothetical protein
MRPVRQVLQDDVWGHWQRIERHGSPDFRTDIRSRLPANLTWFLCEVQPSDADRLYIISSDDWADVSGGSFRVTDVAARLDTPSTHADTTRIRDDIRRKIEHLSAGGQLDARLIAITDSPSLFGPFTLVEGNRRSVAFLRRGTMVGSSIFVGCSPAVVDCAWSRHTYGQFIQARRDWQDGRAEPGAAPDRRSN